MKTDCFGRWSSIPRHPGHLIPNHVHRIKGWGQVLSYGKHLARLVNNVQHPKLTVRNGSNPDKKIINSAYHLPKRAAGAVVPFASPGNRRSCRYRCVASSERVPPTAVPAPRPTSWYHLPAEVSVEMLCRWRWRGTQWTDSCCDATLDTRHNRPLSNLTIWQFS